MPSFSIPLGNATTLVALFSYPNEQGSTESLADTIRHWVDQMLARDGFASKGGSASVRVEGTRYFLDLEGPSGMQGYVDRLPVFLKHGEDALQVIKKIKKEKTTWPAWLHALYPGMKDRLWDPLNRGNWRYFLPLGMAMLNQRVVNFFHYPPMRLLDPMGDYLDDPVPVRLIELMQANGIKTDEEAWLWSTVMDGCPIAAPDDEGTIYQSPTNFRNPAHLLPIQSFSDYQRAQTQLLLNPSRTNSGFTVPLVVYGSPARSSFNALWPEAKLSPSSNPAIRIEIIEGMQTPVLCSGHPYAFYAQAQTTVGAGEMKPEAWSSAVRTMTNDLAVTRWQNSLWKNPKLDPAAEWKRCLTYWRKPEQLDTVYALVLHQGSLWYPDPTSLQFTFRLTLDDVQARAKEAAAGARRARK